MRCRGQRALEATLPAAAYSEAAAAAAGALRCATGARGRPRRGRRHGCVLPAPTQADDSPGPPPPPPPCLSGLQLLWGCGALVSSRSSKCKHRRLGAVNRRNPRPPSAAASRTRPRPFQRPSARPGAPSEPKGPGGPARRPRVPPKGPDQRGAHCARARRGAFASRNRLQHPPTVTNSPHTPVSEPLCVRSARGCRPKAPPRDKQEAQRPACVGLGSNSRCECWAEASEVDD